MRRCLTAGVMQLVSRVGGAKGLPLGLLLAIRWLPIGCLLAVPYALRAAGQDFEHENPLASPAQPGAFELILPQSPFEQLFHPPRHDAVLLSATIQGMCEMGRLT